MKIEWKSCIKLGVTVFCLYLAIYYLPNAIGLLSAVFSAAFPLIIGCVIAYMVNILMTMYEKHFFRKSQNKMVVKCRRPVCMLGAFLTLIAVVVLLIRLVLPQLVSCIGLIFSAVPDLIEEIIESLGDWNIISENMEKALSDIDWKSKLGEIFGILTSGVGNVMELVINALSSVFSGVVMALMSVIFSIYLLLGKDTLGKQADRVMRHYLKIDWYKKIKYMLSVLNDCFHKYIVGQCTEAVILGKLCAAGMLLLKLPYASMIGALIGFTALIPVAGAYIGGAVGAVMIFSVSPVQALIFLVYLVVLQQLEGNLIYPKVVGASMGLPGSWVLAAVTIGGGIMGIAGMLLSVPIAATVYQLIKDDMNKVCEA